MKYFIIITLLTISLIFMTCSKESPVETISTPAISVDTLPPASIANLTIIGAVDSTCLLSWTSPGDDGFTGQAFSYDIRYSTDSISITNWNSVNAISNPPTPVSPGSNQQFLITGLFIDSTYFFGIRTSDDSNNVSGISNIVKESLSPFPQVWIEHPSNGEQIGDLVDIKVNAIDDKGITKVELIVDTISIGIDITPPYEFQWDAHLEEDNSNHVIFARATDTDNNTIGSSSIICTTERDLFFPDKVLIISTDEITSNSVELTWQKSTENDFKQYEFYFLNDGQFFYITNIYDTNFVFTGLLDYSEYQIVSFQRDIFNSSSIERDTILVTTLNAAPPSTIISFGQALTDTLVIKWGIVNIHDFHSYDIYRSINNDFLNNGELLGSISSIDSLAILDTALDSGIVYSYRVIVKDTIGDSSVSNVITFEAQKGNYALRYGYGKSSLSTIPYYEELNILDSFTIEAWIYLDSSGNVTRIVDKPNVIHSQSFYQYSLNARGYTFCVVNNYLGITYQRFNDIVNPDVKTWTHLAMTYNMGEIKMYMNGVLATTVNNLTHPRPCNYETDLFIGRLGNVDDFQFQGIIDEIRIWNSVRTSTEINDNLNIKLLGIENNLIGYWTFDEGAGDVINAFVGNNGYLGKMQGPDNLDPEWVISTCPIAY